MTAKLFIVLFSTSVFSTVCWGVDSCRLAFTATAKHSENSLAELETILAALKWSRKNHHYKFDPLSGKETNIDKNTNDKIEERFELYLTSDLNYSGTPLKSVSIPLDVSTKRQIGQDLEIAETFIIELLSQRISGVGRLTPSLTEAIYRRHNEGEVVYFLGIDLIIEAPGFKDSNVYKAHKQSLDRMAHQQLQIDPMRLQRTNSQWSFKLTEQIPSDKSTRAVILDRYRTFEILSNATKPGESKVILKLARHYLVGYGLVKHYSKYGVIPPKLREAIYNKFSDRPEVYFYLIAIDHSAEKPNFKNTDFYSKNHNIIDQMLNKVESFKAELDH